MQNKIEDLRNHLFATLEALRDKENPMDIERALNEPKPKSFQQWAVVEIMGHQSVVGACSEEQIAGATLLRVDVPDGDSWATQYVGGASIYRLRVVSEEVGRKLAASRRDNVPPFAWELRQPTSPLLPHDQDADDDDGDGSGPDDGIPI